MPTKFNRRKKFQPPRICTRVFFINVHSFPIKAALKTFDEDEDIHSILTDGEDSEALAELKELDPELAKNIADVLQEMYNLGNEYVSAFIEDIPTASDTAPQAGNARIVSKNINRADVISGMVNIVDNSASVMGKISKYPAAGAIGKVVAKYTTPIALGTSAVTTATYGAMLTKNVSMSNEELSGVSGVTGWQKLANIRDQDSKVFDNFAKSGIGLVVGIIGTAAMGTVSGVLPALGVVGACYAALGLKDAVEGVPFVVDL